MNNKHKHKPKYLVRPDDFTIFDLDESNGCYRSWSKKPTLYNDNTRPNAMNHFTFENLTKNYGFFAIEETEIKIYEKNVTSITNFYLGKIVQMDTVESKVGHMKNI